MRRAYAWCAALTALGITVWLGAGTLLSAQERDDPEGRVGPEELGGVVLGPNGPETGVWVIAETMS